MTNREKAVEYMRRLDLIETVESNFNKGILMQSCGGAGILFPADERQQKRARELEEQFSEDKSVVWHIIADTIPYGDCMMQVDAYLITDDMVPDKLMVYGGKFHTFVYVDNLTIPEFSEYGETPIKERFGGLVRLT